MSADARQEILAELGRGDEVAAAERVKMAGHELAVVLNTLPGGDTGHLTIELRDELLDVASPGAEALLQVCFPVIEYGRGFAVDALPRALQEIVCATAAAQPDNSARRVAAVPTAGRVIWALTAYALHCDRPEMIASFARARVEEPHSHYRVRPAVALTALRYPDALGGYSNAAFENYRSWIADVDHLEEAFPTFAADLDACVREADLVLAMLLAGYLGRVDSEGHVSEIVRRLADRMNDERQRAGFDDLFPGEGELEARLQAAYAEVVGNANRFDRPPSQLFAEPEG